MRPALAFPFNDPDGMMFHHLQAVSSGHRRRIQDVAEAISGTVVLQEIKLPTMPEGLIRKELLERYMRSGLSRREFYLQMVDRAEIKETVEVEASN